MYYHVSCQNSKEGRGRKKLGSMHTTISACAAVVTWLPTITTNPPFLCRWWQAWSVAGDGTARRRSSWAIVGGACRFGTWRQWTGGIFTIRAKRPDLVVKIPLPLCIQTFRRHYVRKNGRWRGPSCTFHNLECGPLTVTYSAILDTTLDGVIKIEVLKFFYSDDFVHFLWKVSAPIVCWNERNTIFPANNFNLIADCRSSDNITEVLQRVDCSPPESLLEQPKTRIRGKFRVSNNHEGQGDGIV